MKGRLLKTGHLDGATNMAVDEMLLVNSYDLLKTKYRAILRLYGWAKPTLSLGYFQPIPFDMSLLEEDKGERNFSFEIVRRLTGGGTVLHDIELTYSFTILEADPLIPAKITESYKVICMGIVKGLEKIGVRAEFFDINQSPDSVQGIAKDNFCFAKHSKYDVLFDGKKLVGSAQRRRKGVLLQHGSIILDIDKQKNLYLLERGIDSFQRGVSLKDILGYSIDFEKITQIIIEGFSEGLGIDFELGELTGEELKLAGVLKREKYKTENWINSTRKKDEKYISKV